MRVVSVNVGMPREIQWQGKSILTSIFKAPVHGRISLRKHNLEGDRQSDLTVHGGRDKAVYVYPSESYAYWREELPETEFVWGNFGENLTTEGLSDDDLGIGDLLRVGGATVMVTQPRIPCYKLAARFERPDMVKRFAAARRPGFYFAVVEEGEVAEGDGIEILDRADVRMTVRDLFVLYFSKERDVATLRKALALRGLAEDWQREIRGLLAAAEKPVSEDSAKREE